MSGGWKLQGFSENLAVKLECPLRQHLTPTLQAPVLLAALLSCENAAIEGTAMGSQEECKYAHLLQPIRDLAANWDIDIANELEEYLVTIPPAN